VRGLILGMTRAAPLLLVFTIACSGLYSRNPDGGNTIVTGLGPPVCMRTLSDSISVSSPAGNDAFKDIRAIVFDKDRNLHVLSELDPDSFVAVLAPPSYGLSRTYGRGHLGPVRDLALDAAGNAYVVENFESGPPSVKKFDAKGNFTGTFVANGGRQDEGLATAFDGEGLLNIGGLSRIYRYKTDGTYVDEYGISGVGVGKMLLPAGLTWDYTSQTIWVADIFLNVVSQYTPGSSSQRVQFGGRGPEKGQFDGNETGATHYGPSRVAIDAEGKVYASDPGASRLQKFSPNGGYLAQFDFGTSKLFGAMAIHPDTGVIYAGRGGVIDVICPF